MVLAPNVRIVIEALEALTERVVKKITLDIVANLTSAPSEGGTPVDTGWARANWLPVTGGVSRRGSPRPEDAAAGAAALAGQQQQLITAIATGYKLSQGRITITNNVPYIRRLNEGSSRQAPSGFIQTAIAKAVTRDIRGTR